MKRINVNVILIIGFSLLMTAIILPFAAEMQFVQAKKLEVNYRWRRMGETYQAAAHFNPFNTKYFTEAAYWFYNSSCFYRLICCPESLCRVMAQRTLGFLWLKWLLI